MERKEAISAIAYEIRNPLGLISGFNDLTLQFLIENNAPREVLEHCLIISRSAAQIEKVVNDVCERPRENKV